MRYALVGGTVFYSRYEVRNDLQDWLHCDHLPTMRQTRRAIPKQRDLVRSLQERIKDVEQRHVIVGDHAA
jgi:hypothetical protein